MPLGRGELVTVTFDAGEVAEIVAALEGDSNDAEHDALVAVAQKLGVVWVSPDDLEGVA